MRLVAMAVLAAGCGLGPRTLTTVGPPAANAPPVRPPVGVTTREWDDRATGRRLATTVWYPAAAGTAEERIWWDGIFPGGGSWNGAWRPDPVRREDPR
jgi:hypothetical protein